MSTGVATAPKFLAAQLDIRACAPQSRATAGELSATIAHEVNQPITGIVTRAGAALRWLSTEDSNIDKARNCWVRL